jgi:hypothetical protein
MRAREDLLHRVTGIASLCAVVGCTLLCTTQMSRAQTTGQTGDDQQAPAEVGGSLTDRSNPGLGRPNPLRLSRPLRDANGNLLHHSGRPVEVSASPVLIYPTLIPGPRIDASLLLPASMRSGPILIDIDVMQMFIPWEFRVAGVFKR